LHALRAYVYFNLKRIHVMFFPCSRLILTMMWIFHSSIVIMLILYPHLVVFRLLGYYAEVPGLLAPDSFPILFLLFFFSFSDWPTQNQETHSTINEKKGDGVSTGWRPWTWDMRITTPVFFKTTWPCFTLYCVIFCVTVCLCCFVLSKLVEFLKFVFSKIS